jgi:hypothetical protein
VILLGFLFRKTGLDRFISGLGTDELPVFKKVKWSDLLGDLADGPGWVAQDCHSRGLVSASART